MANLANLDLIHCDERVLHAPDACDYCDKHPDWQALRLRWNINFTGEHHMHKSPCPAELRRPINTINHLPGNRPNVRFRPNEKGSHESVKAPDSRTDPPTVAPGKRDEGDSLDRFAGQFMRALREVVRSL